MVDSTKIKECFKNLIGFTNHYSNDIPPVPDDLKISESGEYFNEFHPALKLNIISQMIEADRELYEYLREKKGTAITQLVNDLTTKKITEGVKDYLINDAILDKLGWFNDRIVGENRFVGFMFYPRIEKGLSISIQELGLQLNGPSQFDMYIYHTSQSAPLKIISFDITTAKDYNWKKDIFDFSEDLGVGTYYIGYYQDELASNAINYTDFDWSVGHCGTCDGGRMRKTWDGTRNYLLFSPIYVPAQNLNADKSLFDPKAVMIDNNKNWGINFKVRVVCDLTDFYCLNRLHLKNALMLKFTYLVLQDIKFSNEHNYINDDLKGLIIRDLEGDKDTHHVNIVTQMKEAIDAVYLDTGNVAPVCLPCTEKGGIDEIGAA